MVLGDLDSCMQRNETRPPTYTIHKNKLKMDKSLKYKSFNTIKVLEENIGRQISDIPLSNILTDTCPKARVIKERINKWDFIKLKASAQLKKTSTK